MTRLGRRGKAWLICGALTLLGPLAACRSHSGAQSQNPRLVQLTSFDLDPKNPERRQFGPLRLLSAFHLRSQDRRFGGLSGLSTGTDGKLYAVSDRGYWVSATMAHDASGTLLGLVDWQITPMLTPSKVPVSGTLVDAEALSRTADGSFLVAFEGRHRIWRYHAPPETFTSAPTEIAVPHRLARAPANGGIEGLAALPDGQILALTEEFANTDGSFKGWLINGRQYNTLSYFPAQGFRVTDCAALANGDVLVLERRYSVFGTLSARVTMVDGKKIQSGAKLSSQELLRLEHPLITDNFEGLAVQPMPSGTMIYLISDDNYHPFQETLLLQFKLAR